MNARLTLTNIAGTALCAAVLATAGCAVGSTGPTCAEQLTMSEADANAAIIDWAKENDERVDQDDPNSGRSRAALLQNRGNWAAYCIDPAHRDDHLGDLQPTT